VEIVLRVRAARHEDVAGPGEVARVAVYAARKEQEVAVPREGGRPDRLCGPKAAFEIVRHELQLNRGLPGALRAVAMGDPDAVAARPVRREVQTQSIRRKGWVLVQSVGIDGRPEIHGVGPRGKP